LAKRQSVPQFFGPFRKGARISTCSHGGESAPTAHGAQSGPSGSPSVHPTRGRLAGGGRWSLAERNGVILPSLPGSEAFLGVWTLVPRRLFAPTMSIHREIE